MGKNFKLFSGAKIIGEVEIGDHSSIWYNAVVRGDIEPIKIGSYSNIQDNCVIHTSKGFKTTIGDYVSVGHAAVLHGCNIKDNVLVGMNATILNGSTINKDTIIGAGTVITEGKEFPSGSLILGVPGRLIRELTREEIKSIKDNALRYSKLAKKGL